MEQKVAAECCCGVAAEGAAADAEIVSWVAAATNATARLTVGRDRKLERSRRCRCTDTPVRRAPTNRWRKMGGSYGWHASAPTASGLNSFKACELA